MIFFCNMIIMKPTTILIGKFHRNNENLYQSLYFSIDQNVRSLVFFRLLVANYLQLTIYYSIKYLLQF